MVSVTSNSGNALTWVRDGAALGVVSRGSLCPSPLRPCLPGDAAGTQCARRLARFARTVRSHRFPEASGSKDGGEGAGEVEAEDEGEGAEQQVLPRLIDEVRVSAAQPPRNASRLQPAPLAVRTLFCNVRLRSAEPQKSSASRGFRAALRASRGELELRRRRQGRQLGVGKLTTGSRCKRGEVSPGIRVR